MNIFLCNEEISEDFVNRFIFATNQFAYYYQGLTGLRSSRQVQDDRVASLLHTLSQHEKNPGIKPSLAPQILDSSASNANCSAKTVDTDALHQQTAWLWKKIKIYERLYQQSLTYISEPSKIKLFHTIWTQQQKKLQGLILVINNHPNVGIPPEFKKMINQYLYDIYTIDVRKFLNLTPLAFISGLKNTISFNIYIDELTKEITSFALNKISLAIENTKMDFSNLKKDIFAFNDKLCEVIQCKWDRVFDYGYIDPNKLSFNENILQIGLLEKSLDARKESLQEFKQTYAQALFEKTLSIRVEISGLLFELHSRNKSLYEQTILNWEKFELDDTSGMSTTFKIHYFEQLMREDKKILEQLIEHLKELTDPDEGYTSREASTAPPTTPRTASPEPVSKPIDKSPSKHCGITKQNITRHKSSSALFIKEHKHNPDILEQLSKFSLGRVTTI